MKRAERSPPKIKREERSRWGTPQEVERRRRIMVSVAAYAYEFRDDPIWSDAKYDREAARINLKQSTGNAYMDRWFKENFKPSTGMWVRMHPDRKSLKRIYRMLKDKET